MIIDRIRNWFSSFLRTHHRPSPSTQKSSNNLFLTKGPESNYLIEIRLIDRQINTEMKILEDRLSKKFGIGQQHYVPHITLVGGFKASDQKRVETDFVKICEDAPLMKFTINGWDIFSENNNVAYLEINPSPELRKFRKQLAEKLTPYCRDFKKFDFQNEDDFVFHGTIALHIPDGKFEKTISFIHSAFPDHINGEYYVDRATLLKNSYIFREYDFFLREKLNRTQARSPKVYHFSEKAKSEHREHKDDIIRLSSSSNRRVFLISDSHFDHQNIIRYTNRNFSDYHSMNRTMLHRWNSEVQENDSVLFIGDLTYGRDSKGIPFWLSRLHGNITMIKGSHDKIEEVKEFHRITKLTLENHPEIPFLLIHDPKEIKSSEWKGWKIHGHIHNNNYEKYPFINGEEKTINVSAELLDYTPLNIEKLFELNFTKIRYMKDIHSKPEYYP